MTELKEYIRKSIQAGGQISEVSRQTRINFFKTKVEEFYRLVNEELLADLREENLFSTSYEDEDIVEDGLGRYNTHSMVIRMGGLKLELRPYGTEVIGARGRIDMWVNDSMESTMFILVPTDVGNPKQYVDNSVQDWVWKMVERRLSKVTYLPLSSDMFQKKILTLASLTL